MCCIIQFRKLEKTNRTIRGNSSVVSSVQKNKGTFRTFLFAGAAVFAVGGANAADLPSGKSGPVSYVKICDAYGAGFFTIPGSDTCVKIGGFVRVEYQYAPGQRIVN